MRPSFYWEEVTATENSQSSYYGKTYRHFFTRTAEHMGKSKLTGKPLKSDKQ